MDTPRPVPELSEWFNRPPELLQRQFPQVLWSGDAHHASIALSYDDGPDDEEMPRSSTRLARHGVTATFCGWASVPAARPDLVKAAVAAGHQIMVHGYRHRSFVLEIPLRAAGDNWTKTRDLIADSGGLDQRASTMRARPLAYLHPRCSSDLPAWGYRPVIGSIVPVHWLQPSGVSLRQITTSIQPGSLLVLHEGLGGPPVAALT